MVPVVGGMLSWEQTTERESGFMELRNLKTFQLAAEHLNFTKAAQELNFTQPTVTAQIQALEQELNQQLFLRIGKKTHLTPAGEILKEYTDQIFHLIDKVETALSELSNPHGNLTIAASETFCTNYFPAIISEYLKLYANVQIKLLSCHTNEVIKGIEANQFDIGIISGELKKNGISNIVIMDQEELVLVVSAELYNRLTPDQLLEEYPFIKYRIDGHFDVLIKQYMQEMKWNPCKIIEFGSLEAVKRAALNQIGIGLVTNNLAKKELNEGTLIALKMTDRPVKVTTSLITPEIKANLSTIKTFTELVLSMWNKIDDQESI